jgi:UDP-N-acetylglucosamine 2-epimerase (non-hydrolysing)
VTETVVKVLHVVGARPNFVKAAPVMAALDAWNAGSGDGEVRFEQVLVHTGQHYDRTLSRVFFEDLAMREPDDHLAVGSGTHAQQTARLLESLEPVILRHDPDLVVVPGDVNSTCAGALVAAKLVVPVVHLEAGLRSGDRSMPEEVNRIVADHLSDLLLTTCADADANLMREGLSPERIVRVGNTMIDSLFRLRDRAQDTLPSTRARIGIDEQSYVLVTLHRPSNVDDPVRLRMLLAILAELARELPVVFPVHLRTRARLAESTFPQSSDAPEVLLTEPLGYVEFLGLLANAAAVITDSGGIQEETSALGIPCVTIRTTTERPITVTDGTNRLADPCDQEAILAACRSAISQGPLSPAPELPLWDGRAAERVAEALAGWASAKREDEAPALSQGARLASPADA